MTTRHTRGDDGGATVELVLLAPLLVLVIGFVLFAGRLGHAAADVRHAAATAARAASLTDTPAAATAVAQEQVNANLADGGPTCAAPAARPTATMVSAENRNGSMPPIRTPASTSTLATESCALSTVPATMKFWNSASAVRAAEPIANPLPIAAVVLPVASRASVRSRTFGSWWVISAMPPALSATGP